METMPVKKFMFELSFDDASIIHRAAERKPVLMKPDQMDALKLESYNAGVEAGKEMGRSDQVAGVATILSALDQSIGIILSTLDTLHLEQNTHTRQLVLAIAKKILPEFMARSGAQEIEPLIDEALALMAREPRLVVRINEMQFDAVNEKAQALAAQRAYPGKVIVLADPGIALGDCRVEWADGGIERNSQATWNTIENTIDPTQTTTSIAEPLVTPEILLTSSSV